MNWSTLINMSDIETSKSRALKILFVDNSKTTRAVMAGFFTQHGFEAVCVGTGPEAIEQLKKEPFDVAVMDLYMPVMNGYEAAKIIRSSEGDYKDIPIIALTASEDPKDIELCKSMGMNEYVIKTPDQKALLDVLERYKQAKK